MADTVIVEIFGLPGSGKTTLLSALRAHGQAIQPFGFFRGLRYAHNYAFRAVALSPVIFRRCFAAKSHTCQEIRWMVRVEALHRILSRRGADEPPIVFLDQGPVYTLARLAERNVHASRHAALQNWWGHMVEEWATVVRALVWLDAPDEILIKRISTRAKWQALKGKPNQEGRERLAQSRKVYSEVIAAFAAAGGLVVLRFDTSTHPADQTLKDCLTKLDAVNHAAENPPC